MSILVVAACGGGPTAESKAAVSDAAATVTPVDAEPEAEVKDPKDDVSPSGAPTVGLDKNGRIDACRDDKSKSTGKAARVFGSKNVKAAYCTFVNLQYEQAFSSLMSEPIENIDDGQFMGVHPYLTIDARQEWDATLKKALNGNGHARMVIWGLKYFAAENPPADYFFADPPYVVDQQHSPAETWVDIHAGEKRLAMRFKFKGDLRMKHAGEMVLVPTTKDLTLYVVPTGDSAQPWLIQDWYATFENGKVRPAPF